MIGQPAHAWVSGQLARAWGNAAFPAPSPREPFCLAAEQHDVGWADADLAPVAGPDGRPLSFMRAAAARRTWRSGAARRGGCSRRAATRRCWCRCTGRRCTSASMRRAPPDVADAIRAYLARAAGAAVTARDGSGSRRGRPQPAAPARARPALADALPRQRGSDARGRRRPRTGAADAPAASRAGDASALRSSRPVAVRGAIRVVVGCEGRRLEGSFAGDAELRAALAAAPWVPLRWELSPG